MNDHVVDTDRYYHLVGVEELAEQLINHVIKEHDIQSYDDFTCDIHRELAIKFKKFE